MTTKSEQPATLMPRLILGAITLFLYVGIAVIAGHTIGLFGKSGRRKILFIQMGKRAKMSHLKILGRVVG